MVADTTLVPSVALHPAVAGWFRERFPDGPTPAQAASWPAIAAGEHTLVAAPTGSGKTLAGFLWRSTACIWRSRAASRLGNDGSCTSRR